VWLGEHFPTFTIFALIFLGRLTLSIKTLRSVETPANARPTTQKIRRLQQHRVIMHSTKFNQNPFGAFERSVHERSVPSERTALV